MPTAARDRSVPLEADRYPCPPDQEEQALQELLYPADFPDVLEEIGEAFLRDLFETDAAERHHQAAEEMA